MPTTKIGVIGCGNICGIYFKNIERFENLEVKACADLLADVAETKAGEFKCAALSVDELLADPAIEIVLNLTIPTAHFEVAMRAVEAGKHIYSEKPIALSLDEARQLNEAARRKGLRVGNAPDTFLGGSHQTCRKLIDDGWIGEPVSAEAFMLSHGMEHWHPNPEFFYKKGGGPLLDMGPYYITALVNMMGPVRRVTASARISFAERRIASAPRYGQMISVETPTHVSGIMEFANGAIGTMITSFDSWANQLPRIEVHGTRGSLQAPTPNGFGGPIKINIHGVTDGWKEMPFCYGFQENSRGVGLSDMANAIRTKRPHRTNGELATHVLDVMLSLLQAAEEGRHLDLQTTCQQPALLPMGLSETQMEP